MQEKLLDPSFPERSIPLEQWGAKVEWFVSGMVCEEVMRQKYHVCVGWIVHAVCIRAQGLMQPICHMPGNISITPSLVCQGHRLRVEARTRVVDVYAARWRCTILVGGWRMQ
jgi:hypothetical protein